MALLQKETYNLQHPTHLCLPVHQTTTSMRVKQGPELSMRTIVASSTRDRSTGGSMYPLLAPAAAAEVGDTVAVDVADGDREESPLLLRFVETFGLSSAL